MQQVTNTRARAFLAFAGVLIPLIGIAYGLAPEGSLNWMFGFDLEVTDRNLTHMLRALTGIYVGMGFFWVAGAFRNQLQALALWSLAVFMAGVASGRAVSMVVDGLPYWAFVVFFLCEVAMAAIALRFLKSIPSGRRR